MRKYEIGDGEMGNTQRRNEDVYEIIAANIKKYRKEAMITQAELAERSNYSHEFIISLCKDETLLDEFAPELFSEVIKKSNKK